MTTLPAFCFVYYNLSMHIYANQDFLKAKYSIVPVRPRAASMQAKEQNEHIMNIKPVDDMMLPMPTSGETIPPAAKHTAPKSADAVPEFSRSHSMAIAVVEVKVSPIEKRRKIMNSS